MNENDKAIGRIVVKILKRVQALEKEYEYEENLVNELGVIEGSLWFLCGYFGTDPSEDGDEER